MDAAWLTRYPHAAALLQRDDDVLLYAPETLCGLDDTPAASAVGDVPLISTVIPSLPKTDEGLWTNRGDW